MGALPFKIEPDVTEELRGRLEWARRNYNFHRYIADGLRQHIQAHPSTHAPHHPKQMKEEQDHARKFLQLMKSVETQINEHLKNYFLIKENLFATALFFYVYTDVKEDEPCYYEDEPCATVLYKRDDQPYVISHTRATKQRFKSLFLNYFFFL